MTDAVDGAERDPLDLELGLENLMRLAAQYDDEEADARAARFAGSLAPTFQEARRIALGDGTAPPARRRDQRARGLRARVRAAPLGAAARDAPRGRSDRGARPRGDVEDRSRARRPRSSISCKERRQTRGRATSQADLPLEVLAIRLGGYALDACGEDAELGPGRGPTAHDTCLWLRKLEGLADGIARAPAGAQGRAQRRSSGASSTRRAAPRSARSTTCEWLGPFAAWWALVIDRPAMLLQLATALPMMAEGALARCCEQAEALRTAVSSATPTAQWGPRRAEALDALHAEDTELAHALAGPRARARGVRARRRAQARTSRRCASSSCSPASACRPRSPIR